MPDADPPLPDLDRIDSVAEEDEAILRFDDEPPAKPEGTAQSKWWHFAFVRAYFVGFVKKDSGGDAPPNLAASEAEHRAWHAKHEYRAAVDYLQLQKEFANRLYQLVRLWLALVIIAVFLNGFGGLPWAKFQLSDQVLIAFITSTTASVIGLFVLVAKWLFANGTKKPAKPRAPRTPKRGS